MESRLAMLSLPAFQGVQGPILPCPSDKTGTPLISQPEKATEKSKPESDACLNTVGINLRRPT